MPSFVWERDTADAWAEPYEYDGQDQFHREAKKVISLLKDHYSQKDMYFDRDERSLEKAIWLIQVGIFGVSVKTPNQLGSEN